MRGKTKKSAPGAGQRAKVFCNIAEQSGVCFSWVHYRRGQSMGARTRSFPGATGTCSGRLHSMPANREKREGGLIASQLNYPPTARTPTPKERNEPKRERRKTPTTTQTSTVAWEGQRGKKRGTAKTRSQQSRRAAAPSIRMSSGGFVHAIVRYN